MTMMDGSSLAVAEATGRVTVQAECTVREATALLEARARDTGQTIESVARGVIDRSIDFSRELEVGSVA